MKKIKLTKGQFTIVDNWRYEELNRHKWQADWDKDTNSYRATRTEYFPVKKKIIMSRVVGNTPKGMIADHRNHDTLDNREKNIRNVTVSQSMMNRRVSPNKTLKEKCISIKVDNGYTYYYVRVHANKKLVYQKRFKFLVDAIQARDKAIKDHHGEFASS